MKYENPMYEVLKLNTSDVITTSLGDTGDVDWGPDSDPTNQMI